VNSKEEVNKISRLISIDNVVGNTVYAYANRKELSEFDKLDYNYTLIQQPDRSGESVMADTVEKMRSWDR
jgi:hypothetical protein